MKKQITTFCCVGKNYSPFSDVPSHPSLAEIGFVPSKSLWAASTIVTRSAALARKASRFLPFKRFISWTNEPRYDSETRARISGALRQTINVFNVFTGNVFWHNLHFLGSYHFLERNSLGLSRSKLDPDRLIPLESAFATKKLALAVYEHQRAEDCEYLVDGRNIDLRDKRQEIALAGYAARRCNIVGRGWNGAAMEESGFAGSDAQPWWTRKLTLLGGYRFSLAFENTVAPYYVTEKIWHAIHAGCVPVYWGTGSTISELFPDGSYVDASQFDSEASLWHYLQTMTYGEFGARLRTCIASYNRGIEERRLAGYPYLTEVVSRLQSRIQ